MQIHDAKCTKCIRHKHKCECHILDGTTLLGIDTRYWPQPLMFPQHARKKYRLPCVNSPMRQLAPIVLWKEFHSFTSRSPTMLLKSARVDHCTGRR